MAHSDPYLRRTYLRHNRELFGGELPDDVEIWWAPCGASLALTFEIISKEEGEPAQLGITIDPCLMGIRKVAQLYLAHEMVHVKLWPRGERLTTHGKKFDEEIQRLTTYRYYRRML